MSNEPAKNLNTNDISLAVLGLLTSATISVTISDGDFTYFTTGAGLILFFISLSFLPRLNLNRYGLIAFALIQSAALLTIFGMLLDHLFMSAGLCALDEQLSTRCRTDALLGQNSIYALTWLIFFIGCYLYVRRSKRHA